MLLTEQELISVYQNDIKPLFLSGVPRSENPSCVFLSGQPGSGKTKLRGVTKTLFDNGKSVLIDQDLIREQHPMFKSTPSAERYSKLREEVIEWRKMLIADAIKENKNILMEGTFGWDNSENEKIIGELKDAHVPVKLAALAVNETVSKLGVYNRYHDQIDDKEPARFVEQSNQEEYYTSMGSNIKTAIEKNLLDELHIYGREELSEDPKDPRIISSFKSTQLRNDPERAIMAYNQERDRAFSTGELKSYAEWAENIAKKAERHSYSVPEFKNALLETVGNSTEKLKNQIVEIAESRLINKLIAKQEGTSVKKHNKEQPVHLKGIILKDAVVKTAKNNEKYLSFAVGIPVPGTDELKRHQVMVWQSKLQQLPSKVSKYDQIELKGYSKESIVGETKFNNVTVSKIISYTPYLDLKKSVTIEGTVVRDAEKVPVTRTDGSKTQAVNFTLKGKDDSGNIKYQKCTVYEKDFQRLQPETLKRNEAVRVEGQLGKPYKNQKGEVLQNLTVKNIDRGLDLKQEQARGPKINR